MKTYSTMDGWVVEPDYEEDPYYYDQPIYDPEEDDEDEYEYGPLGS